MNSSLRKTLFSILLFGVTIIAYQFMIKPANRSLAEQKVRVQVKSAKFEQIIATAKDLNKQLGQLQDAIDFFESKLPSKSETHKILEQVTIIAQNKGLKTKTIRTMKRRDNSGYIEQPLKMQLQGDFNAFYSFLIELERLPRIIKIRELKLRKESKEQGKVTADFIVSIFFQNEVSG